MVERERDFLFTRPVVETAALCAGQPSCRVMTSNTQAPASLPTTIIQEKDVSNILIYIIKSGCNKNLPKAKYSSANFRELQLLRGRVRDQRFIEGWIEDYVGVVPWN